MMRARAYLCVNRLRNFLRRAPPDRRRFALRPPPTPPPPPPPAPLPPPRRADCSRLARRERQKEKAEVAERPPFLFSFFLFSFPFLSYTLQFHAERVHRVRRIDRARLLFHFNCRVYATLSVRASVRASLSRFHSRATRAPWESPCEISRSWIPHADPSLSPALPPPTTTTTAISNSAI